MRSTPEPEPSFALSATDTGEVEYQPFDQPEPSAGKLVEATPVSGSLLGAVTVKPPVWPWRKKTLVPVVEAFVNDPNERLGVAGAVVSTLAVAATAAESLPTLSLIVNVYR